MGKTIDFGMQDIRGKNAVVTGGTNGIGKAIAIQLAGAGANVLIVGRTAEHLSEALQELRIHAKGKVQGLLADLSNEYGIGKVFTEADTHFDQLHILVNNASIGYGSVTDGNYSEWHEVMAINVTSYLACSARAISRMAGAGGHIVNIGSMSAHVRDKNSSVYVAAKAAIQGFSESLRKQVNLQGIKVTLIEPGAVDTEMHQGNAEEQKKQVGDMEMLMPEDIAAAVLYCVSQPERCDLVELKIKPLRQLI